MNDVILFIAFEFPPVNSGGSHRPYKLVNALKRKGLQPVVLTVDVNTLRDGTKLDNNLLEKVDTSVPVHRVKLRSINALDRLLGKGYGFIPDISWRRWRNSVISELPNIIGQYKPTAVYLTCPPFSLSELAIWLKKNYPQLPLITDMRDAWSYWVISPYASVLHFKSIRKQERRVLELSECIIATSKQTLRDFQDLNPHISSNKFEYIPNGFDEFVTVEKNRFEKYADKLKIGYVGSFYYNPRTQLLLERPWYKKKPYQWFQYIPRFEDWRYRSPLFLFQLLNQFKKKCPNLYSKIQLEFAGQKPDWFDQMAEENGVADIVRHIGPLSQEQSIEFQASCDWLLLTSAKVPSGKDYSIAGKTFEYLSLRKPIIALLCEGAQKELLQESGMAAIIDPDKLDCGIEVLKHIVGGQYSLQPNAEFIGGFRMEYLSEKFVEIIKRIVNNYEK